MTGSTRNKITGTEALSANIGELSKEVGLFKARVSTWLAYGFFGLCYCLALSIIWGAVWGVKYTTISVFSVLPAGWWFSYFLQMAGDVCLVLMGLGGTLIVLSVKPRQLVLREVSKIIAYTIFKSR